jgi:hypothetical protein
VGKLLATGLILAALAALALLTLRPGAVVGVSENSMQEALGGNIDSSAECDEVGGDGNRFRCATAALDSDAGRGDVRYEVTVDDWGCWDAKAAGGRTLSDCITVVDLIG